MIKETTDNTFEKDTEKGLVLTDFYATWCAPCKMQSPIIEDLDEEMGDKVTFNKIDIDKNEKTAEEFGIMSIPTLLIKKDGEVVDTIVGMHTKNQLNTILNEYL